MTTKRKISGILATLLTTLLTALPAAAAIFVKIPNIDGETGPDGLDDWVHAEKFSFGVEREMKESGEKGGTEDLNIGIGELQECTIGKSMDQASAKLTQAAATGESIGSCEVAFCEPAATGGGLSCSAHYVMERCYVKSMKSWSTSGDADDRPTEEVAFYYNKIAFGYDDAGRITRMSWDQERNRHWMEGEDRLFEFERAPR